MNNSGIIFKPPFYVFFENCLKLGSHETVNEKVRRSIDYQEPVHETENIANI